MGSQELPDQSVTYSSGDLSSPPDLRLVHYNDVYHVDPQSSEPVGGIARFQTVINRYRYDEVYNGQSELITMFSGDAFNPSLESSITKGSHMIPVLNGIGTDAACIGNHDLDFGVKQFRTLSSQCNFPWLLANVLDPALGEGVPLGNCVKTTMLTSSNGIKIGVIGLAEKDWLDTINSLPPDLIFREAAEVAQELIPELREQGAELIVAATHQREPNDNKLAANIPAGLIDLILGGHDHFYGHSYINGTHVLRSGSDFKQLSYIEGRRKKSEGKGWDFHIVRRDIVSRIPQDEPTVQLVEKLTASLKSKLEKPIGYTAAPLDARFTTVRLRESNIGNFVCDLMRFHYRADCALMAAGTIRGDQIYAPGVLRLKDIMDCFPFEDPVVVLKVKGEALLDALENSVSKYPALEGRFPQVANIELEFDPNKPEGQRITEAKIHNEPIDLARQYVVATRGYMARGKDGYDALLVQSEGGEVEEIVSEENGMLISMILRQYFMSLKIIGRWKNWGSSLHRHWGDIHSSLHEVHPPLDESPATSPKDAKKSLKEPYNAVDDGHLDHDDYKGIVDSDDEDSGHKPMHTGKNQQREMVLARKVARKWWRLTGLQGHPRLVDSLGEGEFMVNWTKAVAPRLEGRIRMVAPLKS